MTKQTNLELDFFDVTEFQESVTAKPMKRQFPPSPSQGEVVRSFLPSVSSENLRSVVNLLASFSTRYYSTSTGRDASLALLNKMQEIARFANRNDTECELFNHTQPQPSVICRILGSDAVLSEELVIVGAHLDSVNSRNPTGGVSPGADDDASGVSSFVEVWRVLLEGGFKPLRTVEFMGYAAEEIGLVGSQDIARSYATSGKSVYAVYQNEMSGYTTGTQRITVLQDYVDPTLTDFVEALVQEYLDITFTTAVCGYGCSDHASWDGVGNPVVCTAEAGPFGPVNPYMHTENDTADRLNFTFMNHFAKLCLAFAVELSLYNP